MTIGEHSYTFNKREGLITLTVRDTPIENLCRMLAIIRREYEIEQQAGNLSPPQECFS